MSITSRLSTTATATRRATIACDGWRRRSAQRVGVRRTSPPATAVRSLRWSCREPFWRAPSMWLKRCLARSAVDHNVTLSQGVVSLIPEKESASEDLIQHADQALYQAKQQGRNRYVVF